MGTRADFYIGTGPQAEWIGSISYNGDPSGVPRGAVRTRSERAFRAAVEDILGDREILSTRPDEGWPWPWEDSRTTDYAYAWCADDRVRVSAYGCQWETPRECTARRQRCEEARELRDDEVCDMSAFTADDEIVIAKSGFSILHASR